MSVIILARQPATVLADNSGIAAGGTTMAAGSHTMISDQYVSVGNDRVVVGAGHIYRSSFCTSSTDGSYT